MRRRSSFLLRGIIYHEFVPKGQIFNTQFYLAIVKHLGLVVWWKTVATRPGYITMITYLQINHFLSMHFGQTRVESFVWPQPSYPNLDSAKFIIPIIKIHLEKSTIWNDKDEKSSPRELRLTKLFSGGVLGTENRWERSILKKEESFLQETSKFNSTLINDSFISKVQFFE